MLVPPRLQISIVYHFLWWACLLQYHWVLFSNADLISLWLRLLAAQATCAFLNACHSQDQNIVGPLWRPKYC